jgi:hypothetical protein
MMRDAACAPNEDGPLKVYRPTRRIRFLLRNGILVAGGALFLLAGGATLYERFTQGPREHGRETFAGAVWIASGLLCMGLGVPPLVRYRRVFTAVYRDRVVISTGLRTRIVLLSQVLRAVRVPDSEGRDPIRLETTDVAYEDLAVKFVNDAEQDEFMVLVNGLVAERR